MRRKENKLRIGYYRKELVFVRRVKSYHGLPFVSLLFPEGKQSETIKGSA